MSIASGFTKMKNYILTSSGYKLLSRWTSSQTVHMGDGTDDTDTVEYRFGAMKGVTSSLATDNDEYALSASAGKNLQDQCTQLNQSLTELNEGSVKYSTFEATVDNWGSIGIVYPSDAHMLIGAYSSDYLLIPETHNPSVKFDSFRCFGRLQMQQLAIAPNGTKIKGWFYYF